MSGRAYSSTEVPVAKSQDELRGLLRKFGADQFSFGEGADWAGVEFVHAEQLVRVRCPVRPGDVSTVRSHASTDEKRRLADEQEQKRVWRVLMWSVKARLVAVEEGLETFEQAFLSHLVDPGSNVTLWQMVHEQIESGVMKIGSGGLRAIGTGR